MEKLFKRNKMDTYKDMKTMSALTSPCDKRVYLYYIGFFCSLWQNLEHISVENHLLFHDLFVMNTMNLPNK